MRETKSDDISRSTYNSIAAVSPFSLFSFSLAVCPFVTLRPSRVDTNDRSLLRAMFSPALFVLFVLSFLSPFVLQRDHRDGKVTRAHEHPLCGSALGNSRVRSYSRLDCISFDGSPLDGSRDIQIHGLGSSRGAARRSFESFVLLLRCEPPDLFPVPLVYYESTARVTSHISSSFIKPVTSRRVATTWVGTPVTSVRGCLASVLVRCEEVVHPSW